MPELEVVQGGLSKQEAVAKKLRLHIERLNEVLEEAKALNMEVSLFKNGFSGEVQDAQNGEIKARVKAHL